MKITRADIEFWNAKHTRAWMKPSPTSIRKQMTAAQLIDSVVNFHAPVGTMEENHYQREAANILTFLRSLRNRGESTIPTLRRIMATPGHVAGSTKRRRSYAIRWYKRVVQERVSQALRGFVGNPLDYEAFERAVINVIKLDIEGVGFDRKSEQSNLFNGNPHVMFF